MFETGTNIDHHLNHDHMLYIFKLYSINLSFHYIDRLVWNNKKKKQPRPRPLLLDLDQMI